MFESLSETARDAAALIPYLELEWKPATLSIALDKPVDDVRRAIHEISDKGIIYRSWVSRSEEDKGASQSGALSVLPLTKDFCRRN